MHGIAEKRESDQQAHWSSVYAEDAAFFGEGPSAFAREALARLRGEGVRNLLELGCGQGRDTFFFAESGLAVTALDYSQVAVEGVAAKAKVRGLSSRLAARLHDLRKPLPFPDGSFDACFSHMLLCMELTEAEIAFVVREVRRVLRPGGVHVYSVRSNFDKRYRAGRHLGEDLYEMGGFVVHFFDEARVRRLAAGHELIEVARMEEGSQPRDLFVVAMRKPAGPAEEETAMADPMGKFQEFFDATYNTETLDRKTRHLVALGASLAIACDT